MRNIPGRAHTLPESESLSSSTSLATSSPERLLLCCTGLPFCAIASVLLAVNCNAVPVFAACFVTVLAGLALSEAAEEEDFDCRSLDPNL